MKILERKIKFRHSQYALAEPPHKKYLGQHRTVEGRYMTLPLRKVLCGIAAFFSEHATRIKKIKILWIFNSGLKQSCPSDQAWGTNSALGTLA